MAAHTYKAEKSDFKALDQVMTDYDLLVARGSPLVETNRLDVTTATSPTQLGNKREPWSLIFRLTMSLS